jgi:hypothetical protein
MPTAIVVHQVVDDALWAKVWEAVTRFSRPTLSPHGTSVIPTTRIQPG